MFSFVMCDAQCVSKVVVGFDLDREFGSEDLNANLKTVQEVRECS